MFTTENSLGAGPKPSIAPKKPSRSKNESQIMKDKIAERNACKK